MCVVLCSSELVVDRGSVFMIIVLDDRTRIHVVTFSYVERNNIQSVVFLSLLFVVCISVVVLYSYC